MGDVKRINLALQGGGAHGAFTWGVLDRLLHEDDIEIAAISGTSAGALNGAALKSGLLAGGRQAARDNLDWLWSKIGSLDMVAVAPWMDLLTPATMGGAVAGSLPYLMGDAISRVVSPYSYGLLYQNPLEDIVRAFDFEKACADDGPAFFVCATNVRSGKIRVFRDHEIGPDVLLASACLPTVFKAVEIDDPRTGRKEAFWDGGYSGNPALFPMFEQKFPDDIVIININPLYRDELPVSVAQIQNRINEIGFNSSLFSELRAIQFVRNLIAAGKVERGTMKDVLIHMIADDELMNELSVATKTVPLAPLIYRLKAAGQAAAEGFLAANKDKIGVASSLDLKRMFG